MWKLSLFCKHYRFSKTVLYITYRKAKTLVLGNTRFISRVEHDISLVRCAHSWDTMFNTRNKSGISAHPCIILYIICWRNKSQAKRDNRARCRPFCFRSLLRSGLPTIRTNRFKDSFILEYASRKEIKKNLF
jgi:hypothetical protein